MPGVKLKKSEESILFINPPYNLNKKQIDDGVFLRNKGTKDDLINELKILDYFVPGHKTEVFCLAAEEARELCTYCNNGLWKFI